MTKKETEDIKSTINWLLHNGDFKDTETAYNIAMNSINTLDEQLFCDHPIEERTWMRSGNPSFCNKCNELVKAN